MPGLVSLADESDEEEEAREVKKEEQELKMVYSWMGSGGFTCLSRRGGIGAVA